MPYVIVSDIKTILGQGAGAFPALVIEAYSAKSLHLRPPRWCKVWATFLKGLEYQ